MSINLNCYPKLLFFSQTVSQNYLKVDYNLHTFANFAKNMHLLRLITLVLCLVGFAGEQILYAKEFVIVLDPGHGGKDGGALGRKTNEKTVNLQVATKLRKMLNDNMNDVKVVMTRDDDRFIPLQKRADCANRHHADIFVSIHANSVDKKSKNHLTIHGAAVYTLGLDRSDTNLAVAMRENEVMKLEQDYTTTYHGFDPSSTESYIAFEMLQHKNMDQSISLAEAVQDQLVRYAGRKNNGVKQAPFWVLVRTGMPSILVELDFICNPEMENFMASERGSTKLAQAIYNGISKYRGYTSGKSRTNTTQSDSDAITETNVSAKSENDTSSSIIYRIQFLTTPRPIPSGDKRLKGIVAEYYKDSGMFKYTTGAYSSAKEASNDLKKIKKNFPDAFVIKTINGQRIK